jgi:hypothetical protein
MSFRRSCQYPQQSDRRHPSTVRFPLKVEIEALHDGSPNSGPPVYMPRGHICNLRIHCKNHAVIWRLYQLLCSVGITTCWML